MGQMKLKRLLPNYPPRSLMSQPRYLVTTVTAVPQLPLGPGPVPSATDLPPPVPTAVLHRPPGDEPPSHGRDRRGSGEHPAPRPVVPQPPIPTLN